MIIFRRRLLFWLIKAYIKKSGKTLFFSFILGLFVFGGLIFAAQNYARVFPKNTKHVVGLVGAYTVDDLPPMIENSLSMGLTKINPDGSLSPAAAESWEVENVGKTYVFRIRDGVTFADGRKLTSQEVTYDFSDVTVERPDQKTIRFTLKDAYSPFLVTASRPIFRKGLVGIKDAQVRNIELNGNFIKTMTISKRSNARDLTEYKFYPSEEALKTAFALGEVNEAYGIQNEAFKDTTFSKFHNVKSERQSDFTQLVTLFYNTEDTTLSDKKIRTALSYALPDKFEKGTGTDFSYPPQSLFMSTELIPRAQNKQHAQLLLTSALEAASSSAKPKITIKTLRKYTEAAQAVATSWKEIGIETKLEELDEVPTEFQVYLGDFTLPRDPDQYTLWHSDQMNNITKFKNLRIDKLLEDGRKVSNIEERRKIYADVQKYLLDESPASFLYFPTVYTIKRQ